MHTLDILSKCQCQFCKGCSAQHCLLYIMEKIEKLDILRESLLSLLDLSKCFDSISQELLLDKLYDFCLEKASLSFINAY